MASYCIVACCFLNMNPTYYCNMGGYNGCNYNNNNYNYNRGYPVTPGYNYYTTRPQWYIRPVTVTQRTFSPAPLTPTIAPPLRPANPSAATLSPAFKTKPSGFLATTPSVGQVGQNTRNSDSPFDTDTTSSASSFGDMTTVEPARLVPRRLFAGQRDQDKLQVKLNYDGTRIGYVAPYRNNLNVWVQDLDEDGSPMTPPKAVTFDSRRGVTEYYFTPLKNVMLYSQDNDGDENTRLYWIDLEERRPVAKALTPEKGVRAELEAVSLFSFPAIAIIKMNARDPRYYDRYRLNLASGNLTMIFRNDNLNGRFLFDDRLQLRVVENTTEGGRIDYLMPQKDSEGNIINWLPIKSVPFQDTYTTRPLSLDRRGEKLFWIDSTDRDLDAVPSGALTEQDLNSRQTTTLFQPKQAEISSVVMNPQNGRPCMVFEYYDYPIMESLNESLSSDVDNMKLLNPNGRIADIQFSIDMAMFLIRFDQRNVSAQYHTYNSRDAIGKYLFPAITQLDKFQLGTKRPFQVRTRDGIIQLCYLTIPPEVDGSGTGIPDYPLPMVLLVHGGPWSRVYANFGDLPFFFANRGYAVLQCNFRGSTGFGKRHVMLSRGEWAGRMQDDLTDAVQWALKLRIAQPKRTAIVGASYGGYATLVGLALTPNLFECGIDIVGPSNLVTLLQSMPPYWIPASQRMFNMVGGNPNTEPGRRYLYTKSPIMYANRIQKPLLMVHGANDVRVRLNESDQMMNALKRNDIQVAYILFSDEGHQITRPDNVASLLAYSEHFLQKCIGGRAEPFSDNSNRSSAILLEQGNLDVAYSQLPGVWWLY